MRSRRASPTQGADTDGSKELDSEEFYAYMCEHVGEMMAPDSVYALHSHHVAPATTATATAGTGTQSELVAQPSEIVVESEPEPQAHSEAAEKAKAELEAESGPEPEASAPEVSEPTGEPAARYHHEEAVSDEA
eukprot:SAG11_NODE_806_length_7093_cov_1.965379_1_plen_134_part_00